MLARDPDLARACAGDLSPRLYRSGQALPREESEETLAGDRRRALRAGFVDRESASGGCACRAPRARRGAGCFRSPPSRWSPRRWRAAALWNVRPSSAPAVVRFSITLPDGQSLGSASRGAMALSPDGRLFAYAANRQLYIRRLDSLEGTPSVRQRLESAADEHRVFTRQPGGGLRTRAPASSACRPRAGCQPRCSPAT